MNRQAMYDRMISESMIPFEDDPDTEEAREFREFLISGIPAPWLLPSGDWESAPEFEEKGEGQSLYGAPDELQENEGLFWVIKDDVLYVRCVCPPSGPASGFDYYFAFKKISD
jgi:hypothetical protein